MLLIGIICQSAIIYSFDFSQNLRVRIGFARNLVEGVLYTMINYHRGWDFTVICAIANVYYWKAIRLFLIIYSFDFQQKSKHKSI